LADFFFSFFFAALAFFFSVRADFFSTFLADFTAFFPTLIPIGRSAEAAMTSPTEVETRVTKLSFCSGVIERQCPRSV
jgi:hypothetical protein